MCLDCGCKQPDEDHGDERHLTMSQLRDAAEASEVSPNEAAQNILETVEMVEGGQQQRKAS